MTKKEITLSGKKLIVDFETETIYKNVNMISNDTKELSMLDRYKN